MIQHEHAALDAPRDLQSLRPGTDDCLSALAYSAELTYTLQGTINHLDVSIGPSCAGRMMHHQSLIVARDARDASFYLTMPPIQP